MEIGLRCCSPDVSGEKCLGRITAQETKWRDEQLLELAKSTLEHPDFTPELGGKQITVILDCKGKSQLLFKRMWPAEPRIVQIFHHVSNKEWMVDADGFLLFEGRAIRVIKGTVKGARRENLKLGPEVTALLLVKVDHNTQLIFTERTKITVLGEGMEKAETFGSYQMVTRDVNFDWLMKKA